MPRWWYLLPAYLTLWTVVFSVYGFVDGNGMMEAFGIDTGGASDFILLNSAGRYIALAVALILGVWVFRTYHSTLTALLARFTMDLMDVWAGYQSGVLTDVTGVVQSMALFLLPNLVSLYFLWYYYRNRMRVAVA